MTSRRSFIKCSNWGLGAPQTTKMKKTVLFLLPVIFFALAGCESLSKMTGTTKSSVTISAVKLVEFPSKQPSGFSWDPLGGKPDIYFTIGKGGMKRRLIENATAPVEWQLQQPFTSSNLAQPIEITFYDKDDEGLNASKDDLIGTVQFVPSSYPAFPSFVVLSGTGMVVQLNITWK